MITIIVLAVLGGWGLSKVISNSIVASTVLGVLIGAIVGFIIAVFVGTSLPTKTSVVASAPLEQMSVYGAENVYLEQINISGESAVLIYQYAGEIVTNYDGGPGYEITYVSQVEPYFEYTVMEFDDSKLPKWVTWFAFWKLTHNEKGINFFLPEESLYVVE